MRVLTIKHTARTTGLTDRTTQLTDRTTHMTYRYAGGGHDGVGKVLGGWLEATQQPALQSNDLSQTDGACIDESGHVTVDGACGLTSMIAIAEICGLTIAAFNDAQGAILGFVVTGERQPHYVPHVLARTLGALLTIDVARSPDLSAADDDTLRSK